MLTDMCTGNITLCTCGVDLRCGYLRLAAIAQEALNIDVSKGNDWVVFVSKRRNVAKIIHSDCYGTMLVTRYLHKGTYQKLLSLNTGAPVRTLSRANLISYLDGLDIEVKRTSFIKG